MTMKKILLLILISIGALKIEAQFLSENYSVVDANDTDWRGIIYSQGGYKPCNCFMVYGAIDDRASVMALDLLGNELWTRTYGPVHSVFTDADKRTLNRFGFVAHVDNSSIDQVFMVELGVNGTGPPELSSDPQFNPVSFINFGDLISSPNNPNPSGENAFNISNVRIAKGDNLGYWISYNNIYPVGQSNVNIGLVFVSRLGNIEVHKELSDFNGLALAETEVRDILWNDEKDHLVMLIYSDHQSHFKLLNIDNNGNQIAPPEAIVISEGSITQLYTLNKLEGNDSNQAFRYYIVGSLANNNQGILLGSEAGSNVPSWIRRIPYANSEINDIEVTFSYDTVDVVSVSRMEENELRWLTLNTGTGGENSHKSRANSSLSTGGYYHAYTFNGQLTGGSWFSEGVDGLNLNLARTDEQDEICNYNNDHLIYKQDFNLAINQDHALSEGILQPTSSDTGPMPDEDTIRSPQNCTVFGGNMEENISQNNSLLEGDNSDNGFKVFPNPAHDQIDIKFDNEIHESILVSIFDTNGSKVYEQSHFSGFSRVRLSNLDFIPGIYLIKINGEITGYNKSAKIVVR